MKILGGKFKGRNFYMPFGIRPTQDMVRKAIFDILGDISGLNFLELFAGSGAIGFEALSRGAKSVTVVEKDPKCIEVIRQNLEVMGLAENSLESQFYLLPKDAFATIKDLAKRARKFDVIFCDPPFYEQERLNRQAQKADIEAGLLEGLQKTDKGDLRAFRAEGLGKKTLKTLAENDILTPNCLILIQTGKRETLPEEEGGVTLLREKNYGASRLYIYEAKEVKNAKVEEGEKAIG